MCLKIRICSACFVSSCEFIDSWRVWLKEHTLGLFLDSGHEIRKIKGWQRLDHAMTSLGRALGPPLKFLPKDLEPSELEAYRHDYQAFRAGHHLGAHGEIEGLQLRAQHAASQAALCSADGAYFSEPERGTTPPEQGKVTEDSDYNYKLAQTEPFWRGFPFFGLWKLGGHEQGRQSHGSWFWTWLSDETASRPDETQLPRVPQSHLLEVARVPLRLEKVLAFGFLLCLDILLHELSFTPLQVLFATPRAVAHALFGKMVRPISVTEKCDFIRLSLLVANVLLQLIFFSNSWVYHYLRGNSGCTADFLNSLLACKIMQNYPQG